MTHKKKAILWGTLPILLLLSILVLYAVVVSSFGQTTAPVDQMQPSIVEEATGPTAAGAASSIVMMLLSFLGLAIIFMIPIGIVMAMIHGKRAKQDSGPEALKTHPEYKDLNDTQLHYITGWSWGAFFFTPIFALANRLWGHAVLSFIPIVSLYVWLRLSIDGRQMAWEKRTQKNFEAFKQRQKAVLIIGIVLFVAIIAIDILATS